MCVRVCVRARVCVGVVTGCVHMYNMSSLTLTLNFGQALQLIHVLFALFTISQGRPQMLYLIGGLVVLLSVGLGLWQIYVSVVHLCILDW